jgi:hypothetical protein
MSNKRILKAYERFDYNGKVVPGSLVLRDRIPKNGKWKEVQTYECCNNDPNCIYFTIEATEGNLDFWFQVFVVDDGGPNLTVDVTWGDNTGSTFYIPAGDGDTINHTFPNAGLFSGTLYVDTPSRVRRIDADIND